MSNLKYLSLEQLQKAEQDTARYIRNMHLWIGRMNGKISGQSERLKWIRKYIMEKKNDL